MADNNRNAWPATVYGLIGVAALGLALVAFEVLYPINPAYPAIIAVAVVAVIVGVLLRWRPR